MSLIGTTIAVHFTNTTVLRLLPLNQSTVQAPGCPVPITEVLYASFDDDNPSILSFGSPKPSFSNIFSTVVSAVILFVPIFKGLWDLGSKPYSSANVHTLLDNEILLDEAAKTDAELRMCGGETNDPIKLKKKRALLSLCSSSPSVQTSQQQQQPTMANSMLNAPVKDLSIILTQLQYAVHTEHLNRAIDELCLNPKDGLEQEIVHQIDAAMPYDCRLLIEKRNRRVLFFGLHWSREQRENPSVAQQQLLRVVERVSRHYVTEGGGTQLVQMQTEFFNSSMSSADLASLSSSSQRWQCNLMCGSIVLILLLFCSLCCFALSIHPTIPWFTFLDGQSSTYLTSKELVIMKNITVPIAELPCPSAIVWFPWIRYFTFGSCAMCTLCIILSLLDVVKRYAIGKKVLEVSLMVLTFSSFVPWMCGSIVNTNYFGCGPPIHHTLWEYGIGFEFSIVGWCLCPITVLGVFCLDQPEEGLSMLGEMKHVLEK